MYKSVSISVTVVLLWLMVSVRMIRNVAKGQTLAASDSGYWQVSDHQSTTAKRNHEDTI